MRTWFVAAMTLWLLPVAAAGQSAALKEPKEFDSIKSAEQRSVALFEEMAKVITSPRCMNCHPVDDNPRQGDEGRLHVPPMVRWDEGDFGPPGLRCSSCHGAEDVKFSGMTGTIPGHEPWRLAPKSMGWIGLSHGGICQQLKDPARNGGRSLEKIIEHHETDKLVGTAWHVTDTGRTPAPGSQELFAALTKAWVATGAHCPAN